MPALERLLPNVGDVLLGRYELQAELNRGAFGLVMTALHQSLGELVIVKILMPHILTNEDMVKRFEREVALAKVLRHPNTIRILDVGRTGDGLPFYVMEHVPGQTLRELLKSEGCLSPERTRRIAIQVLRSLSEAHARGIVHRDLKPGNLLLCDIHGAQDLVKVLDFGVAKATTPGPDDETVTHTGVAVGTPAYMSPEQARGAQDVDGRCDLYSVGLILTECLTGRRALDVRTLYEAAALHNRKGSPPVAPALKDCPILPIIIKATRHLRERRYDTADEMSAALEALHGLSIRPLPGVRPPVGRERQDTPATLPATPTPMSIPDLAPGLPSPLASLLAVASDPPEVEAPTARPDPPPWSRHPRVYWVGLAAAVVLAALLAPLVGESSADRPTALDPLGLSPFGLASASAAFEASRAAQAKHGLAPALGPEGVHWDKLAGVVDQARQRLDAAMPPLRPLRLQGTAGALVSAAGRPLGQLPLVLEHPRLAATIELVAERRGYTPVHFDLALDGDGAVVELARAREGRDGRSAGRSHPQGDEPAGQTGLPFGRMEAFPAPQGR